MHWQIYNPNGSNRVIVTKALPGDRWIDRLIKADCRIEVCESTDILSPDGILQQIGDWCDGAIGQLTEIWDDRLFSALKDAGGIVYSNYAVGYNNVDVTAATKRGIAVGNTPGVLTETTAEMAVALTFAAARRIVEADHFMRSGQFTGWLPNLFLGQLLHRKTLGIIGAGRIGTAYAKIMIEGCKMNLIYHDPTPNAALEAYLHDYNQFLQDHHQAPIDYRFTESLDELLANADVISLHCPLNASTHHLIDAHRLQKMKPDAILINTSRGAVIDESALVVHCQNHPDFRVGLDVFEDEPALKSGLAALKNAVIVPHIASASRWTRESMAILAACNVAGVLHGFPVWEKDDLTPFLGATPPDAVPSLVNVGALSQNKA